MKKVLIVLLFLFALQIQGQELPHIIPPSPTTQEFVKYGMIPVSHYTGVPNISIPIYNLKNGPLNLPISLSYHASGIKLEQEASWVGLGWSLNVGGVISRSIKGMPDERGGNVRPRTIEELRMRDFPTQNQLQLLISKPQYSDSEPDIFTYNFNGNTGQFFLGENDSVYTKSNKNGLDFEFTPLKIIVKDKAGTIYQFSSDEMSKSYNSSAQASVEYAQFGGTWTPLERTAWNLTKITSANGKYWIDFYYEEEKSRTESGIIVSQKYDPDEGVDPGEEIRYSSSQSCFASKRLSSIQSSDGTVINFLATEDRKDVLRWGTAPLLKKLNKIEIKKAGKTFINELHTSYFNASGGNINSAETVELRLRLDGISLYSNPIPYHFTYYGDVAGEPSLPSRHAIAQKDYWGYYNGRTYYKHAPPLYNRNLDPLYECFPDSFPEAVVLNGANMSVDSQYSMANSLKTIKYPTGGSTKFVYEGHTVSSCSVETEVGGIRIAKIINYTNSNLDIAEEYTYDYGNGGDIVAAPNNFRREEEFLGYDDDGDISRINDYLIVSSNSFSSLNDFGGDYIGYPEVTETNGNGSKTYKFWSIGDFSSFGYGEYLSIFYCSTFGGPPPPFIAGSIYFDTSPMLFSYNISSEGSKYGRGLLKELIIKNSQGNRIKETINTYDFIDTREILGMEVKFTSNSLGSLCDYWFLPYSYQLGRSELKSIKNIIYDINGQNPIENITEYTYDNNEYDLVKTSKETRSDGIKILTEYKYPFDKSSLPYTNMTNKNILTPVIEKNIKKILSNQAQVDLLKEYTYYKDWSNEIIEPEKVQTNKGTNTLEDRIVYHKYDDNGNPLEVSKADGAPITYIWGYNEEYPVAKVENATHAQVVATISTTELNNIKTGAYNDSSMRNVLHKIRTGLSNAMVTTYTYDSLIGVTSVTDPKGYIMYYEYDEFNRLKHVKDAQGNLVSENKYHYKNQ